MKTVPLEAGDREAVIRAAYGSAQRFWLYAKRPEPMPSLPSPFDAVKAVAIVREALETLFQHHSPRDVMVQMMNEAPGWDSPDPARRKAALETASFYKGVVARKDGSSNHADAHAFTDPLAEALMLRGVIALTLSTVPDEVVIEFNRQASYQWLAIRTEDGLVGVEEAALLHEIDLYKIVLDKTGITDRFLAAKQIQASLVTAH